MTLAEPAAATATAAPEFETNCLRFILVWNLAAEGLYQKGSLGRTFRRLIDDLENMIISRRQMEPIARYLEKTGISIGQLATTAGLDEKVVKAIVSGNYTPSPLQRQRLAAALGISTDEISWGHAIAVQHLRGNGPQCGRST